MLYLTNLDLNQNELQNSVIQNLATDPSGSKAGQIWFNTTVSRLKVNDGTDLQSFATLADLANYQAKITASGMLKGDGAGGVTAATAGTDYGYPELHGATDPTTSTEGAVGQHYLNTNSGVEFVCKAVVPGTDPDPTTYTWVPVTVDISGKQDTITATGILKGDGAGGVTAAVADTDYQSVITVTSDKALVSDTNGKVAASSVTSTELGYLSGVTSNIQTQLDNIPKLNYLDGVSCTVSDGATQADINTAAVAAISAAYATPTKYDAAPVAITFTPSDKVKDALYMYNGTAWVFMYYTTTGIQRANGTTAGIIEEAASDSDLTLTDGVATVNTATKLRTARNITVQGSYGASSTDGITATAASFDGSGNATIDITAIKTEMLSGQVAVANGGTGKSSITNGKMLVGNSSGGFDEIGIDSTVTSSSDNLVTSGAVAAALVNMGAVNKYSEQNPSLTPSSGLVSWTVTHNLNTTAVTVQVFDVTTNRQVMTDVTVTSANVVTIGIVSSANIAADTYKVVVMG